MARLPRFCPVGYPQHIIQRGNNRSICFAGEEDFAAYANWLKEYSEQFSVGIHAWVFMTNHVHILATPSTDDGVSLMMQALGRRYVRYFNYTYQRTGTLWEGRFKSCIVQANDYLLRCYRYIELNPVRASMVSDPSGYSWSSYRCNALGVKSELCKPHEIYLSLGLDEEERQSTYRELFNAHLDECAISEIANSSNSGLALGSDMFKSQIEELYGRRVTVGKRGRPAKL